MGGTRTGWQGKKIAAFEEIIDAVFQLDDFKKWDRSYEYCAARYAFYKMLDKHCVMSTTDIGKLTNRDHATVLYALKKYVVPKHLAGLVDKSMELADNVVERLDDYIGRVEQFNIEIKINKSNEVLRTNHHQPEGTRSVD